MEEKTIGLGNRTVLQRSLLFRGRGFRRGFYTSRRRITGASYCRALEQRTRTRRANERTDETDAPPSSLLVSSSLVLGNRVLNGGNSLRWHHEIFKWLDEWVGEDAKDVATVRKEREKQVAGLQVQ